MGPWLWREKFEEDADWYPGKVSTDAQKPGRKKVITKTQEATIAKCAMSLKRKGVEPSVTEVVARCPTACLNPETDEPFTAKVILEVFKARCYDKDPASPWLHIPPKQKTALSEQAKEVRAEWADEVLQMGHHSGWYFRHVVWMDPCHSIIPGRPKTVFDQQQASYGKGDRWMSTDSRDDSRNLRTSPYVNKTLQWGDHRVWWYVFLCQGRVHVEVLPEGWSQYEGQAMVVDMLPKILKKLVDKDGPQPDHIFTDRGPGYYHPSSGTICPAYFAALSKHGYHPWAGENSKWQPPDIADILLHETVVSWLRKYMRQHPVKLTHNLQTNIARVGDLLKEACVHINTYYEAEELCHDFPKRLKALKAAGGERQKW